MSPRHGWDPIPMLGPDSDGRVAAVRQHTDAGANFRHSGTVRTKSYGLNVPFMQLERHGWDIHAVSTEPDQDGGNGSPLTGRTQDPGAPEDPAGHAPLA